MENPVASELELTAGAIISEREFGLFRSLICQQTGINLGDTKAAILAARLGRPMRQLSISSFDVYYRFLQTQPPDSQEYRDFIDSVTTNQTSFFREKHHFDFLRCQLRSSMRTAAPLEIWSAACSTGEEPYSIGMTVLDSLDGPELREVKILASDIDTTALQFAETAVYPATSVKDIPHPFRPRFAAPITNARGPAIRIKDAVRDLITFQYRNLIDSSWGVDIKFDFIFCRNVLTYFDHTIQDRILRRFLNFLKPEGFLLVGHNDNLHWLNGLIEPAGQMIYRLQNGVS